MTIYLSPLAKCIQPTYLSMKVEIVVRFTDSDSSSTQFSDLKIPLTINFDRDDVNKLVNTSWFRLMIRSKSPGTERRRLRLIYSGRVLNDQTNFKTDIFDPKLRQMRELGESMDELQLYVHCLVGDQLTPDQLAHEKELDRQAQEVSTAPQVVGFDRLLSQGVSPQDVNDLRRQFQLVYLPGFLENLPTSAVSDVEEDENRQEFIRQLEERWLESTINGTTPPQPTLAPSTSNYNGELTGVDVAPSAAAMRAAAELEGTHHNEDLLLGLVLGAFLGVVAFIFLMMDDTMFNKNQKLALVVGICTNVMFAIFRGSANVN